jgi:hypothetical protein
MTDETGLPELPDHRAAEQAVDCGLATTQVVQGRHLEPEVVEATTVPSSSRTGTMAATDGAPESTMKVQPPMDSAARATAVGDAELWV